MKFGFLIHASEKDDLEAFQFHNISREMNLLPDFRQDHLDNVSCVDLVHIPKLVSKAGSTTEGRMLYLPMTAEEMVADQEKAFDAVYRAAKDLEEWGAGIIGLGAFTGIIGNRGLDLSKKISVPITTGNSFTVYNSIYACDLIAKELGIELREQKVAIVGFPGSIGLAIAKILVKRNIPIILVGRKDVKYFEKIIADIKKTNEKANIEFCNNVSEALSKANIIFSATSSGEIIDPIEVPPWTILLDIAVPGDVKYILPNNANLLYVYGGTFDFREEVTYGGTYGKIFKNNLPGCIGETMLLALENYTEDFSLGRELDIDKIEYIGNLGHKHGFEVITPYDGFTSQPLSKELIHGYKKHIHNEKGAYFNTRTLPSGHGSTIVVDGDEIADFGFANGQAVIGHHPRLHKMLSEAGNLNTAFAYGSQALYTELTSRLTSIIPAQFNRAFYGSDQSGVLCESIRIARNATGRKQIICSDSIYNKMQGICEDICILGTDSLNQLEELLKSEQSAAFIISTVEFQQSEICDKLFFESAAQLCAKYGTLFAVDESLTAFGRLGTYLACEQYLLRPDMLITGPALGAGVTSLNALLYSSEHFDSCASYGKNYYSNEPLLNLPGMMAIEMMQIIDSEGLLLPVADNAEYLASTLRNLQDKCWAIQSLKGLGLIFRLELKRIPDSAAHYFIEDLLSMASQKIVGSKFLKNPVISRSFNQCLQEISDSITLAVRIETDWKTTELLNKKCKIGCDVSNLCLLILPSINVTRDEIDQLAGGLQCLCESYDRFTNWRQEYNLPI